MGLFAQSGDLNYRMFCFATTAALLCVAALVASRWFQTRPTWGPARRAARHVRMALSIALCLGYAALGLLSGLDYFNTNPPYVHHQLALVDVNGLLILMTLCAAAVEFIVARTEHPERSAPPPSRPDLPSYLCCSAPIPPAGTE